MKENDVKVSVFCTTYNHEKFLRKCLDGFVMQKTNFKFEVIVHDDASTDGTKKIIEEYVEKYPDIIIPIYQLQNQYSQGVEINDDIIFPLSKGKYIALCEGDDFWCDENKLQLQFDFMESHPECSACFHNTIWKDLKNNKERLSNNWKKIHYLAPSEVLQSWKVHTTSFFERREYFKKEDYQKGYWFGDYVRLTGLMTKGKLAVLPQIMSVYNIGLNQDSVTYKMMQIELDKRLEKKNLVIQYLNKFNEKTNGIYFQDVNEKINRLKFENDIEIFNSIKYELKKSKECYKLRNKLKKQKFYKELYFGQKINLKIKIFIIFNMPLFLLRIAHTIKRKHGKQCK